MSQHRSLKSSGKIRYDLKKNDFLIIPKLIRNKKQTNNYNEWAKLLAYSIAEGHELVRKEKHEAEIRIGVAREEIINEMQTMGAWYAIIGVFFWIGPLVMALLSVTLKDRANRITNRVLSMIFTGIMIMELSEVFLAPKVHLILLMGSTVVAAAYLIFYSWKWPVKEA